MLYMPKTRIIEAQEWPVASTASTVYEGQVMVLTTLLGIASVSQSAGSSSDLWAGVSLNVWQIPTTAKWVDVITVPSASPYTGTLSNAPISPSSTTISAVTQDGTTSVLTYNSGVASGQFSVTGTAGTTINFNSAQAGNTYYVTYSYTMTNQQAISYYGQGDVLKLGPSAITNTCGIIKRGIVYTDQFDPSQNWFAAQITTIKTGASGVFTVGGSGQALTGVYVREAPSNSFPFLGLSIAM